MSADERAGANASANNGVKNELFDLTGRTAIVTGTSRGLGQNFARALAKAGADLVLTSRHRASLAPFEAEIQSLGRRAISAASRAWPPMPSARSAISISS